VLIDDLQAALDKETPHFRYRQGVGAEGVCKGGICRLLSEEACDDEYLNYEDTVAYMDQLQSEHPEWAQSVVVGNSYEVCVCVSLTEGVYSREN